MHIVWINQHASLVGGAEHYIKQTVHHLREHGVRSTLLYDPNLPTSPAMLDGFHGAFPLVDVIEQVHALHADIVYMHQTRRPEIARSLTHCRVPVVEFFHDHWLFCLRVQKYTTIGRHTCTRPVSAGACYPCIGFIRRSRKFPGLELRTVPDLQNEHQARRHFAGFVTGSSYMAGQAIAHGFDSAKVHVVPLYAEPPIGNVDEIQRDMNRILYVGAVLQYKGIDVLIEAMRHTHHPVKLDIIGDGSYAGQARALVDQLQLAKRITFWGKMAREEIDFHYRSANCLVLPSRTPESFGIVGVEAMSHGQPAIVSDIGGALEWLEPGKTGLTFAINDARALAQSIDLLVANPELSNSMGAVARKRYQERFRPEHHVAQLLGVFDDICSSQRAA